MSTTTFNRDSQAQWYASEHLKTDPGISDIWYLPAGAGEREIRLIEINHLMADRTDESLEPIDFGVDMGSENAHKLFVVDVTPNQWSSVQSGDLPLPDDWSLDAAVHFQK